GEPLPARGPVPRLPGFGLAVHRGDSGGRDGRHPPDHGAAGVRVSPFAAGPSRMTGGGRVAAPVRTVRWLGVPNPIELVKGETYDLSQHVVGGNPPYGDFLIESGS